MKEASGELNMTLVTIIAVAGVLAIFFAFRGPIINSISNIWSNTESEYGNAANSPTVTIPKK